MKILLTGSGGFIGGHVAAALRGAGHEVVPASRSTGFDFRLFQKADYWLPHLRGIDAVVNCVGIIAERGTQTFDALHYRAPVALFYACLKSCVRRVIQISALGADPRAATPFLASKGKADEVLRHLPLDWFILRPSLVVGPGGRSAAFFRRLAKLPVIPLVGGGVQHIRPVHVDDLDAAVCQCLHALPAQRTIDVVGLEVMFVRDRLQALRLASGRSPARIVSIPYPLAMALGYLVKRVVPLCHPDNLRMLRMGSTADAGAFAQLIGRLPRELS